MRPAPSWAFLGNMRSPKFVRAVALGLAAVGLVVACGSESSSQFDPQGSVLDGAAPPPNTGGGFVPSEAGAGEGGVQNCKPLTCEQQGIECGPAGDGCGGLIPDCGKCGSGLRCDGLPGPPQV